MAEPESLRFITGRMMALLNKFLKHFIPSKMILQQLPAENRNSVLLTFDDGPHPESTPRVLDLLDKYDAKAFFFVVGERVEERPGLAREIMSRGHGIGNHTFSHLDIPRPEYLAYRDDIARCQESIIRVTGKAPVFFRPPYGAITPTILRAAWNCGLKVMRWNRDTAESSYMRDAENEERARHFLDKIHGGSIVLSHDTHPSMPRFLELVLPELVARGLDLKTAVRRFA